MLFSVFNGFEDIILCILLEVLSELFELALSENTKERTR